jgi:hypothetical protein
LFITGRTIGLESDDAGRARVNHLSDTHCVRRLSEFQRASYVCPFDDTGMIPQGVVFAEISGCVEDNVNTFQIVSEPGYVADVSYDYASCGITKLSPRFFFGSCQRPNFMACLQKSADQIVS